jgi:hypothetical protein
MMERMKVCDSEEHIKVNNRVNCTFVMRWQTHCKAQFATSCYPIGKEFYPEFAGCFRFRLFMIKEFDMPQIFFGIYLVLGLPAILLLWTALAAARMHDIDEGDDRQRFYRIALATSNFKNARAEFDLLEEPASL